MAMSFECFVYVCTVLDVLQCPLKCCVYTPTCIEEAVVMSIECEFLWYSNDDIMINTHPPTCKLGEYSDQKEDYHLEWPYVTIQYSGSSVIRTPLANSG